MGLKPRSVRVGATGTQCLLVDRKGMDELKSQFNMFFEGMFDAKGSPLDDTWLSL